jgi:hypothetical protein
MLGVRALGGRRLWRAVASQPIACLTVSDLLEMAQMVDIMSGHLRGHPPDIQLAVSPGE